MKTVGLSTKNLQFKIACETAVIMAKRARIA
jgi:hypothetical protein